MRESKSLCELARVCPMSQERESQTHCLRLAWFYEGGYLMERTGTVHSQPSKPYVETELSFSLSFSCLQWEWGLSLLGPLLSPKLSHEVIASWQSSFQCKVWMETMLFFPRGWWGSAPIPEQAAQSVKGLLFSRAVGFCRQFRLCDEKLYSFMCAYVLVHR